MRQKDPHDHTENTAKWGGTTYEFWIRR